MSSRHIPAPRSLTEWGVRLALASVALVAGVYATTFSLSQAIVDRAPAVAHRLAPYNGRITAAYATSLAGETATPADRLRADALAKQALQQDPMAVAAAATLGVNADLRGDAIAAQRYFFYAQGLSRRDLRTQLWMIEDAVRRGDVAGALRQYDITLRVFPDMAQILYPVLTSASSDPKIRQRLIETLTGKPAWASNFIAYIGDNATDARSNAVLLSGLRRAGVAVPESASAGIVNALLTAKDFDMAWSYYASIRPDADRRRSRDARFAAALEAPSQLDWMAINDGSGLATSIQGGIFDFAAPASVGGPMLEQRQLLPPNTYRLSGHSIGIEQAAGDLPYWTLRCQDGRELGRVEMPNSIVANGNFTGTFSVPAGCPAQTLVLMAQSSDAVSGLSGQIDRVVLASAR